MRYFSKQTIILAVFIIISASFMLQVRNFLMDTFGIEAVQVSFFAFIYIAVICCFSYLFSTGISMHRLILMFVLFLLAYFLISKQAYFAEKLHVVEYGALGYLIFRDLFRQNRKLIVNAALAAFFIIVVSLLDEGFQKILPYRVFEIKDITTNILSGFIGMLAVGILTFRSNLARKP